MSSDRAATPFCALLVSLTLLVLQPVAAQEGLRLTLGTSMDLGIQRDQGVSPRIYRNLGIEPRWAFEWQRARWRGNATLSIEGSLVGRDLLPLEDLDLDGYALTAMFHAGGERQVYTQGTWQLWIGAGIEDCWNITYNSRFENASVGSSNLIAIPLRLRAEWNWRRWLFGGLFDLAPLGFWRRPGFAYVDNYTTGDSEIETFGDEYRWNATALPHLHSELSARYILPSGNAFGLSYTWHYLSTHHSGAWRYDAATHALQLMVVITL